MNINKIIKFFLQTRATLKPNKISDWYNTFVCVFTAIPMSHSWWLTSSRIIVVFQDYQTTFMSRSGLLLTCITTTYLTSIFTTAYTCEYKLLCIIRFCYTVMGKKTIQKRFADKKRQKVSRKIRRKIKYYNMYDYNRSVRKIRNYSDEMFIRSWCSSFFRHWPIYTGVQVSYLTISSSEYNVGTQ